MGRYDALLQDETTPTSQSPIEPVKSGLEKVPAHTLQATPPFGPEPKNKAFAPPETGFRPDEGVAVRTPVRVKRTITRYAFEFFQDQVETLKQFSLEEQIRGEKGSMSQMVREAIDAYLAKRKRTEE